MNEHKQLSEMVRRLCRVMGWPLSKSHKFEIVRQTCSGRAAALGIDKGIEIADRIEMYRKRCQYLEEKIEDLAFQCGHIQIKDHEWMSVTEWAKRVIRGDP